MDSTRRTLFKALTWQALGLITTGTIGYVFTGSVVESGALAVTSALLGLICYVMHERLWTRIAWGRM